MGEPGKDALESTVNRVSVGRVYDYLLGGTHNYAVDRAFAEEQLRTLDIRTFARSNRAFLVRAVRYAIKADIRQFVDIGSGLPTQGNVHEVALLRRADQGPRPRRSCPQILVTGYMTPASEDAPHMELVAPENGRVVIPTQVRRAAHIYPGDELVMYVEDGRVVIETRTQLAARIKRDVAAADTGTGSPVDELLAERRAEADREARE